MGFPGVNDEKMNMVTIFSIEVITGSTLLPEGWSGK